MTVITASIHNDSISMSGDRAVIHEDTIIVGKRPKIRKYDNLIAGFAGDMSCVNNLLDYEWVFKRTPYQTMLEIKSQVSAIIGEGDVECLFGFRSSAGMKLYSLAQEVILEHDYYAIGSGYQVALGALYIARDTLRACEAACEHMVSCTGPIDTISL